MTSDRPYRKKLDDNAAFAILSEEAGKQFDPYICRLFIESRDEILKIRDRYEPGKNNPDLQLG